MCATKNRPDGSLPGVPGRRLPKGAVTAQAWMKQRTLPAASGAEESDANSDEVADVGAVGHERRKDYVVSVWLAKGSFSGMCRRHPCQRMRILICPNHHRHHRGWQGRHAAGWGSPSRWQAAARCGLQARAVLPNACGAAGLRGWLRHVSCAPRGGR